MKIRLAAYLQPDSIVDGEGIRTVIWTQGCIHNCYGCHNPETHDIKGGALIDVEEVIEDLKTIEGQDGITFSGGDPMMQVEACLEIAKAAKKCNLNIWCYTGYTFEQLLQISKKKSSMLEFLNLIDVLIDGKFIIEEKSLNLKFRGSKNQRIIDPKKSLETGEVFIIDSLMKEDNNEIINKIEEGVFI